MKKQKESELTNADKNFFVQRLKEMVENGIMECPAQENNKFIIHSPDGSIDGVCNFCCQLMGYGNLNINEYCPLINIDPFITKENPLENAKQTVTNWENKNNIVEKEREHFKDIESDPRSIWGQGYCSALANYKIITEDQFDELISYDNKTNVIGNMDMGTIDIILEELKTEILEGKTTFTAIKTIKDKYQSLCDASKLF